MSRVKRGVTSHKRHNRLHQASEGRKGTRSRLIKPAREALLHALAYATRYGEAIAAAQKPALFVRLLLRLFAEMVIRN